MIMTGAVLVTGTGSTREAALEKLTSPSRNAFSGASAAVEYGVHMTNAGAPQTIDLTPLGSRGRMVETRPDTDLAFIDRPSQRYEGTDFAVKDFEREIVVELEHVRSSAG